MPLKYFYKKYEHSLETEQFSELLPKLTRYFSDKSETAYFIGCGEMRVNGRAMDALLITPNAFVGIEFKNYADDGDIITVIDNDSPGSWLVYNSDGTPKMDKNNEHLSVKGGEFPNPYSQAHSNRQILITTIQDLGLGASILTDRRLLYANRIPYFVVFTKDLDLESKCTLGSPTKSWFRVTTNNKFVDVLDLKLKGYKKPAFTDGELQLFLERWGFNDIHDPSEWRRQKHNTEYGEKRGTNQNRKKAGTTPPPKIKIPFPGNEPSGTSHQKVTPVQFTYDGRILSMSCSTRKATIYYTLDGRIPSAGTTRYRSPFRIGPSKTVKAIAIKKDFKDSDITSFTVPGNPVMELVRRYWLWVVALAVVVAITLPLVKSLGGHQSVQVSEQKAQAVWQGQPSADLYPMLDGKGWIVKRMDGQIVAAGQVNAEIFSPSSQQSIAECRMAITGDYESQHREITFSYDRQTGRLVSPQLGEGTVETVNRMIQLRISFEGWIIER